MGMRAVLVEGAHAQGSGGGSAGRRFERGTRGTAEPLHAGDDSGLWLFEAHDGARLVVPRSSLHLDGEREVAPSPPPVRARGWKSLDSLIGGAP